MANKPKPEPKFGNRTIPRGIRLELWMIYTTTGEVRRNAMQWGHIDDDYLGWRIHLGQDGYEVLFYEDGKKIIAYESSKKTDCYKWCRDNPYHDID